MNDQQKLRMERIQLLPGESFRLLRWNDNVHDVEAIAVDGTTHPFTGAGNEWHHHSQMELTLVTSGASTRFIGDGITHFRAPDLVLIGPDLPHYWHGARTSGFAIQFDFAPEHPFWQFPEMQALRSLWKDAPRGVHFTGAVVPEITRLIQRMPGAGALGRFIAFMQVLDILAGAAARHRRMISSRTFAPPAHQATYRGIQKAINTVFHRFHEDLYFADVLGETGMSKATFERQFKKHTGKNFTRFVTEVRLNFACRKLLETERSIAEIAYESGFNNLSHFNHTFAELHGQSPGAFRRKMRSRI